MPTLAQIAANQANARKSTGPRTDSGKAASSRNHTSHGLCSREFVLEPGEEAEFDAFMLDLRNAVRPDGALELDLFTQLAHASWTLRRVRRAEVHLQNSALAGGLDPLRVIKLEKRLRTFSTYAQRAERTYHKALNELKRLQSTRAVRQDIVEAPLARAVTPPDSSKTQKNNRTQFDPLSPATRRSTPGGLRSGNGLRTVRYTRE